MKKREITVDSEDLDYDDDDYESSGDLDGPDYRTTMRQIIDDKDTEPDMPMFGIMGIVLGVIVFIVIVVIICFVYRTYRRRPVVTIRRGSGSRQDTSLQLETSFNTSFNGPTGIQNTPMAFNQNVYGLEAEEEGAIITGTKTSPKVVNSPKYSPKQLLPTHASMDGEKDLITARKVNPNPSTQHELPRNTGSIHRRRSRPNSTSDAFEAPSRDPDNSGSLRSSVSSSFLSNRQSDVKINLNLPPPPPCEVKANIGYVNTPNMIGSLSTMMEPWAIDRIKNKTMDASIEIKRLPSYEEVAIDDEMYEQVNVSKKATERFLSNDIEKKKTQEDLDNCYENVFKHKVNMLNNDTLSVIEYVNEIDDTDPLCYVNATGEESDILNHVIKHDNIDQLGNSYVTDKENEIRKHSMVHNSVNQLDNANVTDKENEFHKRSMVHNNVDQLGYANVSDKEIKVSNHSMMNDGDQRSLNVQKKGQNKTISCAENDLYLSMDCNLHDAPTGPPLECDCYVDTDNEYVPVSNPDICRGISCQNGVPQYVNEFNVVDNTSVITDTYLADLGRSAIAPLRSYSCDTVYSYVDPRSLLSFRDDANQPNQLVKEYKPIKSTMASRSKTFSEADSKIHTYVNDKWQHRAKGKSSNQLKLASDESVNKLPNLHDASKNYIQESSSDTKGNERTKIDSKCKPNTSTTKDEFKKSTLLSKTAKHGVKPSGIPVSAGMKFKRRSKDTPATGTNMIPDHKNRNADETISRPKQIRPPAVLPKPKDLSHKTT